MARLNYRTIATVFLTALVTALVLGAAVLFVRRDDNAPIQVLLPTPAAAEGAAQAGTPSGAGLAEADLRVHVSGEVRNPGVYTLRPDDRLADAIAAAGGATADAELAELNLARRVRDEEQYHIPRLGETPPAGSAPIADQAPAADATGANANGRLIDLNAASAEFTKGQTQLVKAHRWAAS